MNLKVNRISFCGGGIRPNIRLAPVERTDEKTQPKHAKNEEKCENVDSVNPEDHADKTGNLKAEPENIKTGQIALDKPDCEAEIHQKQIENLLKTTSLLQF